MSGPRIISAGAGSGKTYSLTHKLRELLAEGTVKPAGVIATTFTKLAAVEVVDETDEEDRILVVDLCCECVGEWFGEPIGE